MVYAIGKCGKKEPLDQGLKKLRFSLYAEKLPDPPVGVDWRCPEDVLALFLNNILSCCTITATGHAIQTWTGAVNRPARPTDEEVRTAYSAISGYDPVTGANDDGAYMLDALKFWRKVGIGTHKIGAFTTIDDDLVLRLKQGIYHFEAVYAGLALPRSIEGQEVWDVVDGPDGAPNSLGGHAVVAVAYNEIGPIVASWGRFVQTTWAFWAKHCDEAYVAISEDMLDTVGMTPHGFDMSALRRDLRLVTK